MYKRRKNLYFPRRIPFREKDLELVKSYMFIPEGSGLCRYCRNVIKLLKDRKHLRTHYLAHKHTCYGSRRLDYDHRILLTINELFDKI